MLSRSALLFCSNILQINVLVLHNFLFLIWAVRTLPCALCSKNDLFFRQIKNQDNPSASSSGWDGEAYEVPWLRSDGYARA